jgi:hypothetical protein
MKGDLHMLMMLPGKGKHEEHADDGDKHDGEDIHKAMLKCAEDMIHAFKTDDAESLFASLCDFLDMHKDYEHEEDEDSEH